MIRAALLLTVLAGTTQAEVRHVPSAQMPALGALIDFDRNSYGPEPGKVFERMVFGVGASLDATLKGLPRRIAVLPAALGGGTHYQHEMPARVASPVRLAPEGMLAVADHRGFLSGALFPIGPDGAEARSGRGEGTLAIVFEHDQAALSLDIHADYPDPLGSRPSPGHALVQFWSRDGASLGVEVIPLQPGIATLGFVSTSADIAALSLSHNDPGGIAIDNIRFQSTVPSS